MKLHCKQSGAICIAILIGVSAGCGTQTISTDAVEGTITLSGVPVEGANVMFSPVTEGQGAPAYGRTDAEGRYKLQTQQGAVDAGTTPGEYKVTVSKVELVGTGKFETTPEGKREIVESTDVLEDTSPARRRRCGRRSRRRLRRRFRF